MTTQWTDAEIMEHVVLVEQYWLAVDNGDNRTADKLRKHLVEIGLDMSNPSRGVTASPTGFGVESAKHRAHRDKRKDNDKQRGCGYEP